MHPGTRARSAALLGIPIGAIAAASVYLPIGNFPGIRVFGFCIGLLTSGTCGGLALGTYIGPGLVFGLAYGLALRRAVPGGWGAVAGFVLASLVGNALAVIVTVDSFQWVQPVLGDAELPSEALAGLIGGAVGGGFLGRIGALLLPGLRWHRLMAAGAVLGLLLPLALDEHRAPLGVYLFYMLWQGGYGAALATARRATPA